MKRSRALVDDAVTRGWNVEEAVTSAVREECGFPRSKGEALYDYVARAAGVSRAAVERCWALMEAGWLLSQLDPEAAVAFQFMERIGARVSHLS